MPNKRPVGTLLQHDMKSGAKRRTPSWLLILKPPLFPVGVPFFCSRTKHLIVDATKQTAPMVLLKAKRLRSAPPPHPPVVIFCVAYRSKGWDVPLFKKKGVTGLIKYQSLWFVSRVRRGGMVNAWVLKECWCLPVSEQEKRGLCGRGGACWWHLKMTFDPLRGQKAD